MTEPRAHEGTRVGVLSGAGLSKASGVPTFRDADGLWEGHQVEEVATPEAWFRDRELVRRFYDARRIACAQVLPNDAHEALARLPAPAALPARTALVARAAVYSAILFRVAPAARRIASSPEIERTHSCTVSNVAKSVMRSAAAPAAANQPANHSTGLACRAARARSDSDPATRRMLPPAGCTTLFASSLAGCVPDPSRSTSSAVAGGCWKALRYTVSRGCAAAPSTGARSSSTTPTTRCGVCGQAVPT